MSILRANIFSEQLSRNVNISVILPVENGVPSSGFKTLYLLNGYMGDDLDWITETRIKRLAMDANLAVVMPAGENGFYVNDIDGRRNYSKYIGEELVAITRAMFPLSDKLEDTYIAGLSMGGYGALNNGLKYNHVFSKIGAFSLALVNEIYDPESSNVSDPRYIKSIFGVEIDEIVNTDMDPRYILNYLKGNVPKMYIACGSEDFVYECNELMHEFLNEQRINHRYVITPGEHDWDFWAVQIEQFIKWLKIEY